MGGCAGPWASFLLLGRVGGRVVKLGGGCAAVHEVGGTQKRSGGGEADNTAERTGKAKHTPCHEWDLHYPSWDLSVGSDCGAPLGVLESDHFTGRAGGGGGDTSV